MIDAPVLSRGTNSWHLPPAYSSVTQPSDADLTFLMYLYSVPRFALYSGAVQLERRAAISSSLTLVSILRASASMLIKSPF